MLLSAQHRHWFSDEFMLGIAQQLQCGPVDLFDPAVRAGDDKRVRHGIDNLGGKIAFIDDLLLGPVQALDHGVEGIRQFADLISAAPAYSGRELAGGGDFVCRPGQAANRRDNIAADDVGQNETA